MLSINLVENWSQLVWCRALDHPNQLAAETWEVDSENGPHVRTFWVVSVVGTDSKDIQ